jgi:hypothetical protein
MQDIPLCTLMKTYDIPESKRILKRSYMNPQYTKRNKAEVISSNVINKTVPIPYSTRVAKSSGK